MIFSALINIKEESKKTFLGRIRYWYTLKKIKRILRAIVDHVITYDILSSFCQLACIINNFEKTGISANELYYNKEFCGYILKMKVNENDLVIKLNNDRTINIRYPIGDKTYLNSVYDEEINKDSCDPQASLLSQIIATRIYDYLIAYMKGEYDDE